MDNKDNEKKGKVFPNIEDISMEGLEFVPPQIRSFLIGYMILVYKHGYFIGSLVDQNILNVVDNPALFNEHFSNITANCIQNDSLPES